jgi:hypothetical protein
MRTTTAVRRLEAQRFPAEDLPPTPPLEAAPWWHGRAETPPGPQRPRVRRRAVLTGAAATIVGGLVLVPLAVHQLEGPASHLNTPAPLRDVGAGKGTSPRAVLQQLAARARVQPQPPGTGRYHYTRTREIALGEAGDGASGRILSWHMSTKDREQWIADDGSGREIARSDHRGESFDQRFAAGQLEGGFVAADATEAALRKRFRRTNHADDAAGWILALTDLAGMQVVPPALQSRMLGILAQQPGLTLRGRTVDRTGRTGIAISADTHGKPDTERRLLVFDPTTGALLDSEVIALHVKDLPVKPGSTTGYTTYLFQGYTSSTDKRP